VGGNFFDLVPFFYFHEVGNVEESIALQTYVNEGGLHPGKHPGHASFVDGSCQSVLVLTFQVNFGQLIVFHQPHSGFVRGGRHK
jgi:hypothetical protein